MLPILLAMRDEAVFRLWSKSCEAKHYLLGFASFARRVIINNFFAQAVNQKSPRISLVPPDICNDLNMCYQSCNFKKLFYIILTPGLLPGTGCSHAYGTAGFMFDLSQQSSVKLMEHMLEVVVCLPDSLVNFSSSSSVFSSDISLCLILCLHTLLSLLSTS